MQVGRETLLLEKEILANHLVPEEKAKRATNLLNSKSIQVWEKMRSRTFPFQLVFNNPILEESHQLEFIWMWE
jgi:hypothetical protein